MSQERGFLLQLPSSHEDSLRAQLRCCSRTYSINSLRAATSSGTVPPTVLVIRRRWLRCMRRNSGSSTCATDGKGAEGKLNAQP